MLAVALAMVRVFVEQEETNVRVEPICQTPPQGQPYVWSLSIRAQADVYGVTRNLGMLMRMSDAPCDGGRKEPV